MAKDKKKSEAAEEKKTPAQQHGDEKGVTPRIYELYTNSVVSDLMKRFNYKSVMQVPHLQKICVNVGVGYGTQDAKVVDTVAKDLELIIGQKVVTTKAKKAISNFKLREGIPIGIRVTLRRQRMFEFLDRFISVAVPRLRDFRGFSDKSFDGRGNYTVGVKEHIIFPEIDIDKVTRMFGMDITFVTSAKTDQEAYEMLKAIGMPFVKREEPVEQQPSTK
ncbi:MAG: 50S ribosomal protein L5 [Ignavibacteriae bacterium]|nr:50S ribosomal protein L5 [Ignavibacteriota bacterium]